MNGDPGPGGRDPRKVTGAVLIVIGLLLFALQLATGITVTIMFLVGGAIFIAAYFNVHRFRAQGISGRQGHRDGVRRRRIHWGSRLGAGRSRGLAGPQFLVRSSLIP